LARWAIEPDYLAARVGAIRPPRGRDKNEQGNGGETGRDWNYQLR
jgi:hypothetical protein